jgi:hypothetical protein
MGVVGLENLTPIAYYLTITAIVNQASTTELTRDAKLEYRDCMKHLVWKLGSFLEAHGATPYQLEIKLRATLALEAERAALRGVKEKNPSERKTPDAFSPNTIYKWAKASSVPERIQTATLERILRVLELIAGREVELSEVLAWEDDHASPSPSSVKSKPRKTPSRMRGAA